MTYSSRYLRIADPLMEGIDVTNVQQRPSELGFYEGDITGIYDRDTAEAVREFQQQFGLTADGIVGPETWNAIGISPDLLQYFSTEYNITIDIEEKELTLRQGEQILRSLSGSGRETFYPDTYRQLENYPENLGSGWTIRCPMDEIKRALGRVTAYTERISPKA